MSTVVNAVGKWTITASVALLLGSSGCVIEAPDETDNGDGEQQQQDDQQDEWTMPDECYEPGDYPTSISDDTTFFGCYEVNDVIEVDAGTLTIEPGSVFVFSGGGIRVNQDGRLNAEGTEDAPIRMVGEESSSGEWQGVHFYETRSENNVLSHVEISDGGSSAWGLRGNRGPGNLTISHGARVKLEEITLENSASAGLWMNSSTTEVEITGNNVFTDNDGPPVSGSTSTIRHLTSDTDYTGNDGPHGAIEVRGGDLSSDTEWAEFNVPVRVRDTIEVDEGTFEIAAGNEVMFTEGTGLRINQDGRLKAEGSDDAKIVFSGEESTAGYWNGIHYYETASSDNVLRHVRIADGGGSAWGLRGNRGPGNLTISHGAHVELHEVTIENSSSAGLWMNSSSTEVDITGNNVFTDNVGAPVSGSTSTIRHLNADSDYTGNDGDHGAIEVRGGDLSFDVEWAEFNAPVWIRSTVEVDEGTFDIAAGNELLFGQGTGFRINSDGRLKMEGTQDAPITLEGGETLAGYWNGVYYSGTVSADNLLEHVEIRNGGGSAWGLRGNRGPGNLTINGAHVTGDEVILENSGDNGISLHGDYTFDCQNVTNEDGWNVSDPPC